MIFVGCKTVETNDTQEVNVNNKYISYNISVLCITFYLEKKAWLENVEQNIKQKDHTLFDTCNINKITPLNLPLLNIHLVSRQ